jgi:intracellular septation protein
MTEKKINPIVKLALEMGPIILFFIAYTKLKEDTYTILGRDYEGFIVVTAIFIPVLLIATSILWALTGKLSKMQVMTAVLVVIFGGLSVWLNDDRFIKMKPTILYLFFGGALGFGLLRGRSYLQTMMEGAMPLNDQGWMILTKRVCVFFLTLALLNEFVWRMMSTDTWVNFKTFGLTAAVFVFFMAQAGLMEKYSTNIEEE